MKDREWAAGRSVVAAIAVALAVACAPPNVAMSIGDAAPRSSSHSVIAVQLLRNMRGLTGFDALRLMPEYFSRASRRPAPRFVLVFDGSRTTDFDLLKSILAADLFEIRIINESQTVASGGDVEVIVTTLGGRKGR